MHIDVEAHTIMYQVIIGFGILLLLYILLIKEYFHRTVAAGLTAALTLIVLILLGRRTYMEILEGIDVDTIILLMAMMTMVTIMAEANIFTYLAIKIINKTYKNPFLLMTILCLSTGIISGFIDNVTTVILMTPIIINIAKRIRIDPRPLLVAIILESNIGGTATLIGDPPNILIGTFADLGFNDFIVNLGPIVAIDMIVTLAILRLIFKDWFNMWKHRIRYFTIDETIEINRPLMYKSLIIFSITIVLFLLEDTLGYPPAIPALIGAGLLLATASREVTIHRALEGVEWTTLVFFIFMFIIIRGVQILGVMDFIAGNIASLNISKEALIIVIVWVSAIFSAFVDNIPFVMSMIPVIQKLNMTLGIAGPVLYWALSLGGCLGGNGTLLGASANIVVASVAEKHGYDISFKYFLGKGMPIMIITVGLATIYLLLFY